MITSFNLTNNKPTCLNSAAAGSVEDRNRCNRVVGVSWSYSESEDRSYLLMSIRQRMQPIRGRVGQILNGETMESVGSVEQSQRSLTEVLLHGRAACVCARK